jgi:hypothetical protein
MDRFPRFVTLQRVTAASLAVSGATLLFMWVRPLSAAELAIAGTLAVAGFILFAAGVIVESLDGILGVIVPRQFALQRQLDQLGAALTGLRADIHERRPSGLPTVPWHPSNQAVPRPPSPAEVWVLDPDEDPDEGDSGGIP